VVLLNAVFVTKKPELATASTVGLDQVAPSKENQLTENSFPLTEAPSNAQFAHTKKQNVEDLTAEHVTEVTDCANARPDILEVPAVTRAPVPLINPHMLFPTTRPLTVTLLLLTQAMSCK